MDYRKLTELQMDALKEIGNIGAGNAATALSQMIQRRINMNVPQIDILPVDDIVSRLGGKEDRVIAVVLRVFGDAPGNILFLLTMESSYRLVEMLTGRKETGDLDEFEMSALEEIGNILSGAYLNSIVKFTKLAMVSSVPAISNDMLFPLMTSVFMESEQFGDYIMSIEAKFSEGDRDIKGYFFYIPKPGSLEKIISKLGLM
ncbi:MAG: chemotaxis protein CheC [Clostridiales bacterium]|nr:chemotaxis protein CheC [Clostridiales bacterium]HBM81534.1 CheY-P-specific phosphatase CheC [Clostridiaceae bacterium]